MSIVRRSRLPEEAVGRDRALSRVTSQFRHRKRKRTLVAFQRVRSSDSPAGPSRGRFEFLASLVSSSDAGGAAYLAYTARRPQRVPFQEGASKTAAVYLFVSAARARPEIPLPRYLITGNSN